MLLSATMTRTATIAPHAPDGPVTPEAALARELGLDYAVIAVSANAAAGRGESAISMAMIEKNLADGMEKVRVILEQLVTTTC